MLYLVDRTTNRQIEKENFKILDANYIVEYLISCGTALEKDYLM